MHTQQSNETPVPYQPEPALKMLQDMEAEVQSDMTKQQIAERLLSLSQQAFLMRNSGREIKSGVIDDHVRAIAANAVLTHRLRCKLSTMVFNENHSRATQAH